MIGEGGEIKIRRERRLVYQLWQMQGSVWILAVGPKYWASSDGKYPRWARRSTHFSRLAGRRRVAKLLRQARREMEIM